MQTRFIKFIIALLFTGITMSACSSNEDNNEPIPFIVPDNVLSGLTFKHTTGSQMFSIQAPGTVTASSTNQEWCTVEVMPATAEGIRKVSVNVKANEANDARSAEISIVSGKEERHFTVTQEGAPALPEPDPDPEPQPVSSTIELGLGWNLGNQLDAFSNGVSSETAWGNPVCTQALFNKLAEAGISTVRIPVTWLGHVGAAPDYKIDAAWLDRLVEIVGYAEQAGLKAIVNIHHDGGTWLDIKKAATDASFNTGVKAQLKAMWTQIANRMADKSDFLLFESMNEIHDGGWGWGDNRKDGGKQYATLNEWNQVFVDAVRATGGNNASRWLCVPSYCTNPDYATAGIFALPSDPVKHLIVAVHYYTPIEFTLNDEKSEWGHTGSNKANYGDEATVRSTFAKLKAEFVDKGIPVYIGETGCVHRSAARSELFRRYYMEYVCKAAKDYGMSPVYWDNGAKGTGKEQSGLFNRTTGAYLNTDAEALVKVMVKAITETSPAYTLESVYNSAPK